MISYIFLMFYVNIDKYENYNTPTMKEQLKQLNKTKICEYIGNILAEIINDKLNELEQKNSNILSKIEKAKKELDNSFKKNLFEDFKKIIGEEYAEKLIKKL